MSAERLALEVLARRLERAQARQNERLNAAAHGQSLAVGGGYAHRRGPAHPLNQALGLTEPIAEAELVAVEQFLGAPTVLELSPAADPNLWALLARRGYRVHQFQQLWVRALPEPPPTPAAEVRQADPDDADRFSRVVAAGFLDHDDWRAREAPFPMTLDVPDVFGFLVWADGEPAGGGLLGVFDGVALLSGDAVLPRFRGRGLQKALVNARLAHAGRAGCDVACAGTEPGTASQRTYEACGFRVAYPKLELARG